MNRSLIFPRHFAEWPFDEFFRSAGLWPERYDDMRGINADVYENSEEVVVKMAIPGIKPEDINLQVTSDTLTITGQVDHNTEESDARYLQKQLYSGRFTQMITLPTAIQADKAQAEFASGIVTLKLPKSEEVKPKTIKIKAIDSDQPKLLK